MNLAGIELSERHRELLAQRSRRLGMHEGRQLDFLLDAAESGDAEAIQNLISVVTTKFSGFFRHPRHFKIAAEHALRAVQDHGRARLWSAAAATGEEPYSLAMVLTEAFGRNDPPACILATDVDASALEMAERGEYQQPALKALDPARRERFFTHTSLPGRWQIAPSLRGLVHFRLLNLSDVDWGLTDRFDVIFCRNVLMYLESCHRYAVIERMASLLAPGGALLLDPAEHLGKAGLWFSQGNEGIYFRKKIVESTKDQARVPPLSNRG